MSNVVLFILVGVDLSYPEGIPDVRLGKVRLGSNIINSVRLVLTVATGCPTLSSSYWSV